LDWGFWIFFQPQFEIKEERNYNDSLSDGPPDWITFTNCPEQTDPKSKKHEHFKDNYASASVV
jgi:hypothetical protein